jgi:hypothetical protein
MQICYSSSRFGCEIASLTAGIAAELSSQSCIHCGDDYSNKREVMVDDVSKATYVECFDRETCARRLGQLRLMGINL